MPGMIPREARGPGARREGEAHGASARAGARRARQGGRGGRARAPGAAGRTSRARGATGTGRRGGPAGPAAAPPRAGPWARSGAPSPRERLGELRRARVRGRDARGVREGLRGVPGHVPARAHGAQRGHGPRPCAREGAAVSCQVDGTRPGESPAGRRPGSAAGMPREPQRSAQGRRPMEDQSSLSGRCSKRCICRTSWARRPFFLATARTLPRRLASFLIPAVLTSPPGRPAAPP